MISKKYENEQQHKTDIKQAIKTTIKPGQTKAEQKYT